MDYTPSPSKLKSQYSFLDDSIEIARKVSSPSIMKPLSRDTDFKEKQRQFYSKYTDLSPRKFSNEKSNITPSTRLFKPLTNEIPLDDDVKISSNMVEKIIRQNETLKQQLKEERKERVLINNLATGLKEKLIKYKRLNDSLEQEKENWLKKKDQKIPEFTFNPNNTRDIFETNNDDKNNEKNDIEDVKNNSIEERINQLESEISKSNDSQESKFEFIKNEIEFLKELLLKNEIGKESKEQSQQLDEPLKSIDTTSPQASNQKPLSQPQSYYQDKLPTDDDIITSESEELQALQERVALFERKIQLRKENELRKYELKQQLSKLASELNFFDTPSSLKTPEQTPLKQFKSHSSVQSTPIETKNPIISDRLKTTCSPCSQKSAQFVNIDGTKWYN